MIGSSCTAAAQPRLLSVDPGMYGRSGLASGVEALWQARQLDGSGVQM